MSKVRKIQYNINIIILTIVVDLSSSSFCLPMIVPNHGREKELRFNVNYNLILIVRLISVISQLKKNYGSTVVTTRQWFTVRLWILKTLIILCSLLHSLQIVHDGWDQLELRVETWVHKLVTHYFSMSSDLDRKTTFTSGTDFGLPPN